MFNFNPPIYEGILKYIHKIRDADLGVLYDRHLIHFWIIPQGTDVISITSYKHCQQTNE